ncbi:hypothetical protein NDU88_003886 [Pleurodeles waltl]|uniref:Uncharacterized protein n=1 Tax=Pleurodeles waltl TaxID=8319 RepID=A0AAV7WTI6_PLEWA|nr:hypothetical protein NDU88_003886 [Pleurodeles waltl]
MLTGAYARPPKNRKRNKNPGRLQEPEDESRNWRSSLRVLKPQIEHRSPVSAEARVQGRAAEPRQGTEKERESDRCASIAEKTASQPLGPLRPVKKGD